MHLRGIQLFVDCIWYEINKDKHLDGSTTRTILNKLVSGSRLSINDVTNNLSHLNKQDDDKFRFAPILVSTNREKVDINEYQAKRLGILSGDTLNTI